VPRLSDAGRRWPWLAPSWPASETLYSFGHAPKAIARHGLLRMDGDGELFDRSETGPCRQRMKVGLAPSRRQTIATISWLLMRSTPPSSLRLRIHSRMQPTSFGRRSSPNITSPSASHSIRTMRRPAIRAGGSRHSLGRLRPALASLIRMDDAFPRELLAGRQTAALERALCPQILARPGLRQLTNSKADQLGNCTSTKHRDAVRASLPCALSNRPRRPEENPTKPSLSSSLPRALS